MNHRFLMKRVALLLFAGLFGLATLQTATAQDNHDVTIEVAEINKITVNGAPTIDIASGEIADGSGNLQWNSGGGGGSYDVETNVNSLRKIEVSASKQGDATIENYGLKVTDDSDAPTGGGFDSDEIVLTDVDDGILVGSGSAKTLIDGFKQVGEFGLDLAYEGKVNYEFNPGDQNNAKVKVTYTLTSSGNTGGGQGGNNGSN